MGQLRIQDRIHWGLNVAARAAGARADAYRPSSPSDPLAASNRYLQIHVLFTGLHGSFERPNLYGAATSHGIFDAAYTRPGDYLVQGDGVWFIASQEPLLPVLCVRCNRTVSLLRATATTTIGAIGYGGNPTATTNPVMTCWPASVLGASSAGQPQAQLPGDVTVPYWTVLLPGFPGIAILPGDLMSDDLDRRATVAAAELSELGWRLTVRQATT